MLEKVYMKQYRPVLSGTVTDEDKDEDDDHQPGMRQGSGDGDDEGGDDEDVWAGMQVVEDSENEGWAQAQCRRTGHK